MKIFGKVVVYNVKKEVFILKNLKLFIITFLLMLTVTSTICAYNPNEPMQKQITLQTEIKRGINAVKMCDYDTPFSSIKELNNLISINEQENMDTDGFLLGAYFMSWIRMNFYVTELSYNNWPDAIKYQYKYATGTNLSYYNQFRAIQARYNITDLELCELTQLNPNFTKKYFDKYWILSHQRN